MRMRTPVWRRGLRDVTGERCWSAVPGGREPPPGSSRSVVVTLMNGGYIIWGCLSPPAIHAAAPEGRPGGGSPAQFCRYYPGDGFTHQQKGDTMSCPEKNGGLPIAIMVPHSSRFMTRASLAIPSWMASSPALEKFSRIVSSPPPST